MDDKTLLSTLNFDPLATAEDIVGSKNDTATLLGMSMMWGKSAKLKEELKAREDSYFGISLESFLRVIKTEGFEEALRIPFTDDGRDESLYVFFKPSEGLLLEFTSYNGNLNGGSVYYNWNPNIKAKDCWSLISSGSFRNYEEGSTERLLHIGSRDCREALRFQLQRMRDHGNFLPKWKEAVRPWLCHYEDKVESDPNNYRVEMRNRDILIQERIAMLPSHVQEAIKGESCAV
jgi:hypothetical protein